MSDTTQAIEPAQNQRVEPPANQSSRSLPPEALASEIPDVSQATAALWQVYDQLNEWILFADAKAGAILAAVALIATIAPGLLKDHLDKPFVNMAVVIGALGLILAGIFAVRCISPRLRTSQTSHRSLLYFGHVAKFASASEYAAAARQLANPNKAFDEVSRQVWENSRIAATKHAQVRWAVLSLAASLVCAIVAWAGALVSLMH